MNFSLILGLFLGLASIAISIFGEVKNPVTLANPYALLIVVGGTLFAGLVCFRFSHLFTLLRVLWTHVAGRKQQEIEHLIHEAVDLSRKIQSGAPLGPEASRSE